MSRIRVVLALCLLGLVSVLPSAGFAISTDVVISQVYGGGGNTGAQFKNDYVELFNRGSTAVDLTGWSVQYASATGNTWTVANLTGTIAPGRYYLVVQGAGAGAGADLPAADAVGTAMMSANNGKVALVTSTSALTCGASADCLPNANIRD
ncbi:MAG TPA: lamin tail domain-containing protein, partial [Thermoleophilaceae bacterium]|nr:lamin tail domain-containing protein [Thermoleophilaceae bacterium]